MSSYSSTSKPSAEPQIMTEKHKDIIVKNLVELASGLRVDPVLDRLEREKLITDDEAVEIQQESTPKKRARALVRLLLKLEDRAFYVFIDACHDNAMSDLAKLLRDADMKAVN